MFLSFFNDNILKFQKFCMKQNFSNAIKCSVWQHILGQNNYCDNLHFTEFVKEILIHERLFSNPKQTLFWHIFEVIFNCIHTKFSDILFYDRKSSSFFHFCIKKVVFGKQMAKWTFWAIFLSELLTLWHISVVIINRYLPPFFHNIYIPNFILESQTVFFFSIKIWNSGEKSVSK